MLVRRARNTLWGRGRRCLRGSEQITLQQMCDLLLQRLTFCGAQGHGLMDEAIDDRQQHATGTIEIRRQEFVAVRGEHGGAALEQGGVVGLFSDQEVLRHFPFQGSVQGVVLGMGTHQGGDEFGDLLAHITRRRRFGQQKAAHGPGVAAAQGDEQGLLVGKVLVERADADPGDIGDAIGGEGSIAVRDEKLSCGVEEGGHRRLCPLLARHFTRLRGHGGLSVGMRVGVM